MLMIRKNIYYLFSMAFLVFVFLLGLYVYSTGQLKQYSLDFLNSDVIEELTAASSCPNLLIRKGNVILLYNTTLPVQDGVNPWVFTTMDDYVRYYNDQAAAGNTCDALYLQEETTAQGQTVMRVYPNIAGKAVGGIGIGGGGYIPPLGSLVNPLPVVIDKTKPLSYEDAMTHPPVNRFIDSSFNMIGDTAGNDNPMYAGYDPQGQYVGRYTNLDQIHDSTQTLFPGGSPNAADDNWGGVLFTEDAVKSGYYDENNVMILTG